MALGTGWRPLGVVSAPRHVRWRSGALVSCRFLWEAPGASLGGGVRQGPGKSHCGGRCWVWSLGFGGLAGRFGRCRQPVGCLWRGLAWSGWVRAAAVCGALWPAGWTG